MMASVVSPAFLFSHLKCTENMYFAGLPQMIEIEKFELLLIHKAGWGQELFQTFWALKKDKKDPTR